MKKNQSPTEFVATETENVSDWLEFAGVLEQPVSGDLLARGSDEVAERVAERMMEDPDLMAEAVDWLKMSDVSVRGMEDEDVVSFISDHYGAGLVDFYMENYRATERIVRK